MKAHARIARQRVFDAIQRSENRFENVRVRLDNDGIQTQDVQYVQQQMMEVVKDLVDQTDQLLRLFAFINSDNLTEAEDH